MRELRTCHLRSGDDRTLLDLLLDKAGCINVAEDFRDLKKVIVDF